MECNESGWFLDISYHQPRRRSSAHPSSLRLDLGLSSLNGRHDDLIGYNPIPTKTTASKQVLGVPKNIGLVSRMQPYALNPWGQSCPVWVGGLLNHYY
jgi:hypothetical protein